MSDAPSFKGLRAASAASSRAKSSNRRSDTQPELILRRELWHAGFRFRKNVATLPGKPDIVFTKAKVAVFCDGDFWHGREWDRLSAKLKDGTNAAYWLAKIAANMDRDTRHNESLERSGWRVIRLWETDIKSNPAAAVQLVSAAVLASR